MHPNIRKIEILVESPELKKDRHNRVLVRVQPMDGEPDEFFVKDIEDLDKIDRCWVDNILSMAASLVDKQKRENAQEEDDNS